MASLSEQEADLEAQIKTYRTQVSHDRILLCSDRSSCFPQLSHVKEKVSDGSKEVGQLISDLEQLIDLSEGTLPQSKGLGK